MSVFSIDNKHPDI